MTEEEITRKVENIVRYSSNSLPHSLNWQQDLQRHADENRRTAQKIRDIIVEEK